MKLSSVRPSVPSIDNSSGMQRDLLLSARGQEISIDSCSPALGSKCRQCHVDS